MSLLVAPAPFRYSSLCFSKTLKSNCHTFQVLPKYRPQLLVYLLRVELSHPNKDLLEFQPPVPQNVTYLEVAFMGDNQIKMRSLRGVLL